MLLARDHTAALVLPIGGLEIRMDEKEGETGRHGVRARRAGSWTQYSLCDGTAGRTERVEGLGYQPSRERGEGKG